LGLILGLVGVLLVAVTGYFWYQQYAASHPKHLPPPVTVSGKLPPAATAPAPKTRAPAPGEAGTAGSVDKPTPGVTPSSLTKRRPRPVVPDPSLPFRTFVDHLKVAVRAGPPTRLIVNDLSYRPGDVIDPKLGIVFVGVDADTKELIFEEPSGARIRHMF
jgi:hypothetical protein